MKKRQMPNLECPECGTEAKTQMEVDWREKPKLYEIAKIVCHSVGLPWTDPRTGKTYLPPKKKRLRKIKNKAKEK